MPVRQAGRFGSLSRRNPAISAPTPDDTERAKSLFFEALALADARDHAGAEARLRAALALVPDRPSLLTNLAAVLFSQKRYGEALGVAQQALERAPGNPQAMLVAGNSLALQGRFAEAAEILQRIVADAADDAEAWAALGTVLAQMKRFDDAVPAFRRALAVRPDLEFVRGALVTARMYAGDWVGLEAEWAGLIAEVRNGLPAARPFDLLSIPATPADQLACARTYVARECPAGEPLWRGERCDHDRIRLAYVCADYGGEHPVTQVMVGLFEQHDRTRFETIAVATEPGDGGPGQERVKRAFDQFIEAGGMSDLEIAELLRRLEVDIAVDLNGHTQNPRTGAFALRPAPLQVSYIAYPGSMGAAYIDYLIADPIVVPEADRQHYVEKIVTLPETYFVTDDAAAPPPPAGRRSDHGLPDNGFVFCSFNNSYKVNPEVFDLWMRLLREVEGSVLWLRQSNPAFETNLKRAAEAHGVASSRLVFAPRLDAAAHLARHRHADLFLDTLTYNAHTTACDALWMGLPVLTRLGTTFAGRVGASLLHAVGLPELVTASNEEYFALALALAREPDRLAAIKAMLSANRRRAPLFDTARQTRHVEAAFAGMMERHTRGLPPADFAVPPFP